MKEFVEVPAPIPDSLITYPCSVVGPGKTQSSLAKAYTKNTSCVGEYENTVDDIKQYNDKQKELKDGKADGM